MKKNTINHAIFGDLIDGSIRVTIDDEMGEGNVFLHISTRPGEVVQADIRMSRTDMEALRDAITEALDPGDKK